MFLDYDYLNGPVKGEESRSKAVVVGDVTVEGGGWNDVREGHKQSAGSLQTL